ncbi:hypothetical protein BGX34_004712 [Mortierella sp. NVP85]|nr:hypothetical protein BGX34_004712 [Mortierella sp. NVP85]
MKLTGFFLPIFLDNSGRRINELSALLSRNGISIFYLSTRITDLILVKEKRLKSVLPTIRSIFSLSVDSDCDLSSRGFTSGSEQGSYPGSSFTSMNSFLHTPSSPSRYQSTHYQYYPSNQYPNPNSSYTTPPYSNPPHPFISQQQQAPYQGNSFSSSYKPSTGISIPFGRRPSTSNFGSRGGFFSASGRLHSESDASSIEGNNGGPGPGGEAGQGMTSSQSHSQLSMRNQRRRQSSIADSSFGEGIGRYFPKRPPHGSSYDSLDSLLNPVGEGEGDIQPFRVRTSFQTKDTRRGSETFIFPPLTPSGASFPGIGSLPSFGLIQETLEEKEEREFRIKEQMRKSCPRSVIDDKLVLAGLAPDNQAEWAVTLLKVLFYPEQLSGFSWQLSKRWILNDLLILPIAVLHTQDEEVLSHFEEHVLNQSPSETMLRCIQVDLSTFGQDTYGLVYSMSNPLVDHDVNLLCLSTLRTANVLVHDSDLEKSLKVLI